VFCGFEYLQTFNSELPYSLARLGLQASDAVANGVAGPHLYQ